MSTSIVVVNVSVTQAPQPSTLQQTGAFISQGGTNTAVNTLTFLPNLAALTAILAATKALSTLTWSASVVTATTAAPHGWTNADVVLATIAGATPAAYNGTFSITITGASTFTYPLVSNPGAETIPGTVILQDEAELLAMGTTYFAQNGTGGVYVLELGEGTPTEGVAALTTYITSNPNTNSAGIYGWLIPREWDGLAAFHSFLLNYTANNAKVYFWITTTVANRAFYAALKDVFALVEAPGVATTNLEFSCAAPFAVALRQNPSSTNQVPPMSYVYLNGVTAYPIANNATVFSQLATANVGWVGTGAEGGISNTILFQGQMSDGNPWNFWYSADWAQINIDINLSNEVINGSNNNIAPLYYNQTGINRLQNRAASTMNTAVGNGLALGQVVKTQLPAAVFQANYSAGIYLGQLVINADPFVSYNNENPNDYAIGKYAGLSCVYTPLRGFLQIFFQLNVTNFA